MLPEVSYGEAKNAIGISSDVLYTKSPVSSRAFLARPTSDYFVVCPVCEEAGQREIFTLGLGFFFILYAFSPLPAAYWYC